MLEGGVAESVAEAVGDLVVVVPGALAGGRARLGGCVALAERGVVVTGLVVLVAGVDALGLDYVLARGVAELAGGAGENVLVGIGEVAHVLRGRRGVLVHGVGVGQRDVLAGLQRQAAAVGGVVLQQDGALGLLLTTEVDALLDQGARVARPVRVEDVGGGLVVLVEGLVGRGGRDELLAGGAEVGVNRGAVPRQPRSY